MATYNFTGTNGDPLPSGLTAQNGTFEINSNKLKATGASPGGPLWVVTGDSTADGTFSAIINGEGATTGASGIVFRYSDNDNMWMCNLNHATGDTKLYKRVSGTWTQVGSSYVIPSHSNTTNYTFSAELSGSSIVCKIDGTTRHSTTDSFNSTATKAGARYGETTSSIDDLTMPDNNTITIPEAPANNFVYQRNASNAMQDSLTVTYTGSPTALQYRVLHASDDTTEVLTWTTFDASPTGGTSVLTPNITASTTAMHIEVRFSNDTGVTDLQTNDFYVGIRGLVYGQSFAQDLYTDDAITAATGYIYYNGTTFAAPTTGRGQNDLAQKLIDMYACAVCLTNTASGGTAMTYEADTSTNNWSNSASTLFSDTVTRVTNMTDSDQLLEFALWIQGDRDAVQNVSYDNYLRLNETGGFSALLTNSRSNWTSKTGGVLPVICGVLGRNTGDVDANWQAIRDAHLHMCNADDLLYNLSLYHHATDDGQHPNDAGDTAIGEGAAVLLAYHNADISVKGPKVIAVDRNAGATEFTLEFDSDLDTSVTTYSTEGVRLEDAGTPKTISSFTRTATRKAKITVSTAVTNTDDVRIYLGYGCGSTSSALTYPQSAAITLPNSAGTYKLPAENFNISLLERV